MQLRLALPKGRLMAPTAALLEKVGVSLEGYSNGSRSYRPVCPNFPGLRLKVFQEKDIPIQVAVGNYDLGICGLDWVEELMAKFPASFIVKVKDLGYGFSHLHLIASAPGPISCLQDLKGLEGMVRLASEYPNLADTFALRLRLKRFQVFPLWGNAEVYPPESAEVALVSCNGALASGLHSLTHVLTSSAFLIANRRSWESRNLAELLSLIEGAGSIEEKAKPSPTQAPTASANAPVADFSKPLIRLALPDGHQQPPTMDFLRKAGLNLQGYAEKDSNPRPIMDIKGVAVKVIRPQDMPLQVACGNFDLAITGHDWVCDHLSRFPTSPVTELLNLGFGKVRVVAVVPQELPVETGQHLRGLVQQGHFPRLRVASEYINLADKYARDNHLGHYQIIPTWGASEAFLPEDADLLIENTQTGRTLAENNLRIIDTIVESQACLIGRKNGPPEPASKSLVDSVVDRLRRTISAKG